MLPYPPQILEEATDFLVFSSEFNCLVQLRCNHFTGRVGTSDYSYIGKIYGSYSLLKIPFYIAEWYIQET